MEIDSPTMDEVDAIASLWVDLARGQRAHGSRILPEENRTAVRESIARHVVTEGVLVARPTGPVDGPDRDGESSESALLGFVTFVPESDGYELDRDRGVIENLYVRPDRRGEGIGTDLLAAAERSLRDDGLDAVTLEVMAANDEARRFYERNGYEPHRLELEKRAENDTDSKVDR